MVEGEISARCCVQKLPAAVCFLGPTVNQLRERKIRYLLAGKWQPAPLLSDFRSYLILYVLAGEVRNVKNNSEREVETVEKQNLGIASLRRPLAFYFPLVTTSCSWLELGSRLYICLFSPQASTESQEDGCASLFLLCLFLHVSQSVVKEKKGVYYVYRCF